MKERPSRSVREGIAAVVLLVWVLTLPLLGQAPTNPPAANPAPPTAQVPARAPVDPFLSPPSQEPLPVEGSATPTTEAREPAKTEPAGTGQPEKRPAEPAATEPGPGISKAPIQTVPVPYLPTLPAWEHQLEAYRAAAKGELTTALDFYELALTGEPDNLRWGTEYRQVLLKARQAGRGEKFLERLAREHPAAANLQLNLGYVYVDQMPGLGPLAALNLAGQAQRAFSRSIEIEPSWLAYYSRGSSYLYWPPMMKKTVLGIADLEKAIALAEKEAWHSYHALAWTALGDGFWRLGERDQMRATWKQGRLLYPRATALEERLALADRELDDFLLAVYRPGRRIDTGLEVIWQAMREEAP